MDSAAGETTADGLEQEVARLREAGWWAWMRCLVASARPVAGLARALVTDRTVPAHARVVAWLVLTLVVVPGRSLLPARVTQAGLLVDGVLLAWSLRWLVRHAETELLRRHWTGEDAGLAAVLVAAGRAS